MSFAVIAASLTAQAADIARAGARARSAARRREGAHWHRAEFLWPLFARRKD